MNLLNYQNKIFNFYLRYIIIMGTAQSNQGAQDFFNNLGSAITNDIASPGNIALGVSNLLNGIGNMVLPICIVAGLYLSLIHI